MTDLKEGIWNLALQPLKTLYLLYHNAYGHQTCQDGDLPREAPAHKITRTFGHVILGGHVTN